MLRSNLLTKILSLLIALVLSACNLPEPKETKEGDGSTFALTTFEGKVNSQILNQKTGLRVIYLFRDIVFFLPVTAWSHITL